MKPTATEIQCVVDPKLFFSDSDLGSVLRLDLDPALALIFDPVLDPDSHPACF
jgi:hypothetical protein